MKKVYTKIVLLYLSTGLFFLISSTCWAAPIFTDHFTSQNPQWNWDYHSGTGYQNCPVTADGLTDTICEIGITDQTSSSEYSDGNLHEMNGLHNGDDFMSVNLRCTHADHGTQGWGMWDYNAESPSVIRFWWGDTNNDSDLQGLRAMVSSSGTPLFNQVINNVDVTQRHTYQIIRGTNFAQFVVDGELVATYNGVMPSTGMRYEVWVDNAYYNDSGVRSLETIDHDQRIYIDYLSSVPFTYDFNADGHPDIVWRNPTTGENWVWFLDGTTFTGSAQLFTVPAPWEIVGR